MTGSRSEPVAPPRRFAAPPLFSARSLRARWRGAREAFAAQTGRVTDEPAVYHGGGYHTSITQLRGEGGRVSLPRLLPTSLGGGGMGVIGRQKNIVRQKHRARFFH